MKDCVPIQNRKFLAWLQSRLPAPIRVPFSDEVIHRMAKSAHNEWHQEEGDAEWNAESDKKRSEWCDVVRAALAAGGLEPCAVPDYAPEDVAFTAERASDEELLDVFHTQRRVPNEQGSMLAAIAAVRARVEAPLLAEIAELEASCAWNKQAADSLRAELESVTAERDAAQAERDVLQADAAAIFDLASQDGADTALESVRKLKEYTDTIEWREAHTESANKSLLAELAALRQPVDATPTDAQVESLAKAMHAKTRFLGWNEMLDVGRESWRNSSRAAYTHIGRVPVGAELDVTAEEALRVYVNGGKSIGGMHNTLDLCRSRIKPIYECEECVINKAKYLGASKTTDDLYARINAARAALECE